MNLKRFGRKEPQPPKEGGRPEKPGENAEMEKPGKDSKPQKHEGDLEPQQKPTAPPSAEAILQVWENNAAI